MEPDGADADGEAVGCAEAGDDEPMGRRLDKRIDIIVAWAMKPFVYRATSVSGLRPRGRIRDVSGARSRPSLQIWALGSLVELCSWGSVALGRVCPRQRLANAFKGARAP